MEYDIYVGSPAIDRPTANKFGSTRINANNPANKTGVLTKVAVYMSRAATSLEVATFYKVDSNTLSTRDCVNLGNVPAGYSEHTVSLQVVKDDLIGCFFPSGYIRRSDVGDGYWSQSGDHIPCTNQSFSFYSPRTISLCGYTLIPPTPTGNFLITSLEQTQFFHGYTIITHSDVICHMWLRLTSTPPLKHLKGRRSRGLEMLSDARFCVVNYGDIEQEEEGDTLIHTFILNNWEFCTWKYFYFWATLNLVPKLSTSALIHKFYPGGDPPFRTSDEAEKAEDAYGFCQYWNAQSQTFTPDHTFVLKHLDLMLCRWLTTHKGPYTVKLMRVDGSCWAESIVEQWNGYSTDLPLPGAKEWTRFTSRGPFIFKDTPYRIVVHTTSGWFSWDGTKWVENEAGAALQWWVSLANGPYTRGAAFYGCNFRDKSGSWLDLGTWDFTFILWQLCPS